MKDTLLKAIVGLVITAAVALAVLFLRYEVKAEVETQLTAAGYPSSAKFDLMRKDVDTNTENNKEQKEISAKLDDKIERIVGILLEP